jgi:hypothetical protein
MLSKQDTQNFVGEAASAVKSFLACPGAKRKGLLSTSFEISTQCDCYDDAIIPSPYGLGRAVLRRFGPGFLKGIGRRVAPTSLLKASSSFLDSLRATKVALRNRILAEIRDLTRQITDLDTTIEQFKNFLKTFNPIYALANQNWTSALSSKKLKQKRVLQISDYFKELLGKKPTIGSSPPSDWQEQVFSGRFPGYTLGTEAEWDDVCRKIQRDGFAVDDPLFPSLNNDIGALEPLEEINLRIAELDAEATRQFAIMEGIIRDDREIASATRMKNSLERRRTLIAEGEVPETPTSPAETLVPNKNSLDTEIAKLDGEINDLNNGRDIVDSLDSYSGFTTYIVDFVITLVSYLSLVDKHTCQDPSMLNQDTCLCSECPPDKQLCQNPYGWSLPQPPGTAWADERNSCVDKCCGGQTTQYYNAIVTYGCFCDCPDLDASGNPMGPNPSKTLGEKQVLKRCRKSGVSKCDGGTVCAPANPPDYDTLWPFQSSKYTWDEESCNWIRAICSGRCVGGIFQKEFCEAECSGTYEPMTPCNLLGEGETISAWCIPS